MHILVPLPVAVPLLSAPTLLVLRRRLSRAAVQVLAIGTSLAVSGLGAALLVAARPGLAVYWFGGWRPRHGVALGISFAVDSFGAAGVLLVGLVTTAALVVAGPARRFGPVAHALTLVLLAWAAGFCLTGDLFNIFVFFELMSVCTIALCAIDTGDVRALRGALHFAISNTIGAIFVLIGIALLYARTGALNLASIGQRLATHRADALVVTALALLTVGFLIKAAIVPFHFWLADTATVAPAPVSMLLVGVLDTLGLYAVARIYWTAFAGAHAGLATLEPVLIAAGVITAAIGAVLCLAEVHPTRRLAFVAISHSGLMLIAVGLLNPLGLAGFGLFACGDGAVKASLFALDAPRRAEEGGPGGWPRSRGAAALLLLAGLALAGMPPAVTYLAKGLTESGTSGAGRILLSGVVLAISALTGGAVLALALPGLRASAGGPPKRADQRWSTTRVSAVAALALVAGAFAIGLVPGIAAASLDAASRFTDRPSYEAAVLRGRHRGTAATTAPNLDATAVALGAGAAIGALGVGVWRLRRGGGPPAGGTPLGWVRRLHAGRVTDSVAWITFGTAVVSAALALGVR